MDAVQHVAIGPDGMRKAFVVLHCPRAHQLLHPGDGSGGCAEFRASVYEGDAMSFRLQLQHPVQRRITTTENHQALAMEVAGILHLVVNTLAFEYIRSLNANATWLK